MAPSLRTMLAVIRPTVQPKGPEPHRTPTGHKAGLLTYKRKENGECEKWNLRKWTFAHHLTPKWILRDES